MEKMTTRKEELQQDTHIAYGDLIRIYSIIAIVILHVSAPAVASYHSINLYDWWVSNFSDSATRWGVPVFVMLSGDLLLNPLKVESSRDFFKKRAKRTLVPFAVWFTIYLFWNQVWQGVPLTFQYILRSFAFGSYYHLYFFHIIIAMYLITPALRSRVREMQPSAVVLLCAFFLFVGSVNSLVYRVLKPQDVNTVVPLCIHFFFFIMGFVGYYACGYYLRSVNLSVKRFHSVIVAFLLTVAVTAIGTAILVRYFGIETFGLYLYDYFSPFCILMAISMFLIIKESSPKESGPITQELSSSTFGVYLMHPLFIDVLSKLLPSLLPESFRGLLLHPFKIAMLSTAVIISSFATTFLLRKIPYLRKIVE